MTQPILIPTRYILKVSPSLWHKCYFFATRLSIINYVPNIFEQVVRTPATQVHFTFLRPLPSKGFIILIGLGFPELLKIFWNYKLSIVLLVTIKKFPVAN